MGTSEDEGQLKIIESSLNYIKCKIHTLEHSAKCSEEDILEKLFKVRGESRIEHDKLLKVQRESLLESEQINCQNKISDILAQYSCSDSEKRQLISNFIQALKEGTKVICSKSDYRHESLTSSIQSVAEKEWNKHDSDDSKEISFYLRSAMNEIAELGDIYVLRKKEQALRALDRDLTTVMLDTCKVSTDQLIKSIHVSDGKDGKENDDNKGNHSQQVDLQSTIGGVNHVTKLKHILKSHIEVLIDKSMSHVQQFNSSVEAIARSYNDHMELALCGKQTAPTNISTKSENRTNSSVVMDRKNSLQGYQQVRTGNCNDCSEAEVTLKPLELDAKYFGKIDHDQRTAILRYVRNFDALHCKVLERCQVHGELYRDNVKMAAKNAVLSHM